MLKAGLGAPFEYCLSPIPLSLLSFSGLDNTVDELPYLPYHAPLVSSMYKIVVAAVV
jgi:hypothetical protein